MHKDPGVSVFSASSSIIQMHFWIYWKSVKAWKLNTFKVHRCPMFTNFFLFNFCFNLMSWFVLSNSFWNCSCFFLILKFSFFLLEHIFPFWSFISTKFTIQKICWTVHMYWNIIFCLWHILVIWQSFIYNCELNVLTTVIQIIQRKFGCV